MDDLRSSGGMGEIGVGVKPAVSVAICVNLPGFSEVATTSVVLPEANPFSVRENPVAKRSQARSSPDDPSQQTRNQENEAKRPVPRFAFSLPMPE
jgi:hypothetical protein